MEQICNKCLEVHNRCAGHHRWTRQCAACDFKDRPDKDALGAGVCPECGGQLLRVQCLNYPARGRAYCRRHGGAAPVGEANGQFTTGEYSEWVPRPGHVPKRYAGDIQKWEEYEGLFEARRHVALLEARLDELLRQLDDGEDLAGTTGEMRVALSKVKVGLVEGDGTAVKAGIMAMTRLLRVVEERSATWGEIYTVMQHRSRLILDEAKAVNALGEVYTRDQLAALAQAHARIALQYVPKDSRAKYLTAVHEALSPRERVA